jgi:hypothetical protein
MSGPFGQIETIVAFDAFLRGIVCGVLDARLWVAARFISQVVRHPCVLATVRSASQPMFLRDVAFARLRQRPYVSQFPKEARIQGT